jgi:TonB-dependent receptor
VEFPLTTRLQLVGGARLESWTVNVASVTTTGAVVNANPSKTDILPSLGLNYALTQDQNLRFAATQTVSRPEYRELSPIAYFEQVGFAVTQGNPGLDRALIQNVDLRWEWFPRGGEILSAGVFYKHFDSPIEKVYIQSAGANILSYVNAAGANNYGLELEARKNLDFAGGFMKSFTAFANVTVMKSSITVGNDSISAATNPVRPMVGQSPYIINAGLLWAQKAWAASLLYNVQGQRILEAGTGGIPDAYEKPRSMLDATLQIPVLRNLTAKVEARNLLNARYLFEQGGVVRQAYYSGRIFGIGFKWEI